MFQENCICRPYEGQYFLEPHAYGLNNQIMLSNLIENLIINEIYQRQYLQNYELLKMAYKKKLSSVLTKEQLKSHQLLQYNYEIYNPLM